MGVSIEQDGLCVKAYDPSTRTEVGTYRNYRDAGNKLGIDVAAVKGACGRKGRSFSSVHNKELALRLALVQPVINQRS